jgi:hypothetical protein
VTAATRGAWSLGKSGGRQGVRLEWVGQSGASISTNTRGKLAVGIDDFYFVVVV